MPPKIRAIVFDIGRVLIRVDISRAMQGLAAGTKLSPGELWAIIEKDPRWVDWQEGRIPPAEWHRHLSKRLGAKLTLQQFTEVWNRALDPKPIHEDAFFELLAKKYKLALLSNTDPIHVQYMEGAYSFFQHFSARTYSCAIGASKPNPVVYKHALESVKARAQEALYVDDIVSYVEAAKALGMAGVQFQSAEQLTTDLQAFGVNCS